jgi:hypothetical protein
MGYTATYSILFKKNFDELVLPMRQTNVARTTTRSTLFGGRNDLPLQQPYTAKD